MARRFLDDVRDDINNQIIANASGLITADVLRPLLIDTIDSTIQDECAIAASAGAGTQVVGDTYTVLSGFDTDIGGDGSFLLPDAASDQVQTSTTAGFTYSINASVVFEGDSNDRYDFTILENGIPIGIETSETGEGNNDPVTASASAYVLSAPSAALYQVAARGEAPGSDLEVLDLVLRVLILPTNNP